MHVATMAIDLSLCTCGERTQVTADSISSSFSNNNHVDDDNDVCVFSGGMYLLN